MRNEAEAAKVLVGADRVLILLHKDPDGDTIGGSLALGNALEHLDKKVTLACADPVPKPFRFLPGAERIQADFLAGDVETLVLVDCGDLIRCGFPDRISEFQKRGLPIINIDHHPKNDVHRIATINVVDQGVAAAVQIVAKIIDDLDITIDADIATCLLCGLYTDTGGFRHSNADRGVLKFAAELLLKGARLRRVVKEITGSRNVGALKLVGLALSRVKVDHDLGLATSVIRKEDLELLGVTSGLGGVVNIINSIPGTRAAVLFTELPNGEIKGSVRTETEGVDVGKIAALFGGGGHKKAAGFRFKGRVETREDGDFEVFLD
jgi:phosphoesterase RecJ-like protein